ncbi:MAG: biopolymer transporter ExbD [Planctomycetota bacterium]|nr:biopolymer transporter ExbD [Planctomycetota bacterium]MDA1211851.1 biopolymer transporter ExbD [Planctomycetota bacterium]
MLQKLKRSNRLLVEPPAAASGDIAFNLIVFFLVCASIQPDRGFKQTIPRSETQNEQKQDEPQNIEIQLTRTAVLINGTNVPIAEFVGRLRSQLSGKTRPEDRVVIVKSQKDTPYKHWIDVTTRIEEAGGIVTLQMEEERTVTLPQ